MKYKTLIFLFAITLFSSCNNIDEFKFKRGTKQIYQAIYYDNLDNVICEELIDFIGTGEKTDFSQNQDKIYYNFHISSRDSAKFVEQPRMYKDFTYALSWQKTFSQGIIQNQETLWLHPLRANQYRFTQNCPFPEARFPLEVGKQWNSKLSRGTDLKTPVSSEYKVVKEDSYKGEIGFLDQCWYINSISTFGDEKYRLNMIYHKTYGFVKFEYLPSNGDRVDIELIGERSVSENEYLEYQKRDERNR